MSTGPLDRPISKPALPNLDKQFSLKNGVACFCCNLPEQNRVIVNRDGVEGNYIATRVLRFLWAAELVQASFNRAQGPPKLSSRLVGISLAACTFYYLRNLFSC